MGKLCKKKFLNMKILTFLHHNKTDLYMIPISHHSSSQNLGPHASPATVSQGQSSEVQFHGY